MIKINENKIRVIYLGFLFFVLIFILGSSIRQYDKLGFVAHKYEILRSGWQRILPDGSKKNLDSTGGKVLIKNLIIERQLPEEVPYSLTTLYVRTVHQDITVWVDKNIVYDYTYADIPPFNSKTPPIYWVRIPIRRDMLGKTIQIEFRGRARNAENTLNAIYFGEDLSIVAAILWKSSLQILSSLCLIFMGIGMWAEYILVNRKQGAERGVYYLGLCLFFIGLWMGSQVDSRQLLFNNVLLLWNLEYISLIMIPIPSLLCINKIERNVCQREIYAICMIIAVFDAVFIISAGIGLYSFIELNLPIDLLILLTCLEIARSFYVIKRDEPALFRELTWLIGAGTTMISFSCIELLSFFLNGYENQGKFLSIGGVLFAFQMLHAQGVEYDKVRNEKAKLEVAEKIQSEFFANMSHEIRTPINTVIGMNEMILRESHDDAVLSYAQDIQASGQNLLSLVNDILDFSRIESGGIKLVPKAYELAEMLHDINSMIRFRAEWKGLRFSIIVDEDTPAVLFGDSFRVREVILNLLDNAIKYTEKGSISLSVSFREMEIMEEEDRGNTTERNLAMSCISPDSYLLKNEEPGLDYAKAVELCFTVKDTGVGIKESDQNLIFQKFQRVHTGWHQNVQGTGLGLPITHYFVNIMNGHIGLQSKLGEGSSFSAYLPQLSLKEDSIGNYEERYLKQKGERRDFDKGFIATEAKILVVDDNELNVRLVQNLLKRTEVQIDIAYSGEECLEKLKKNTYDIVYLDFMMPGMDGEETLKRIRELEIENRYGRPIPVIAFSSNMLPGMRQKYLSANFDAYLAKPVEGKELEKTLYTFLPENLIRKKSNEEFFESEMKQHSISEDKEEEKILNREMGLKYCMQDEAVYREILSLFRDSSMEKMRELESAFENADYVKYRLYAHGLKTTSLTVGAIQVSEDAKKLEHAAKRVVEGVEKEEAMHYIRYNHNSFMRLYQRTVQEIAGYLQ